MVTDIWRAFIVAIKVFPEGLMVDMASKKIFQAVLCPTQLFQ